MNDHDQEVIREFLVESHENLSRLDQELVELEQQPKDAKLLASIFRTIHTIKGTCGFLGFPVLERITHQGENILSQLRDGKRDLTPELVSLILDSVDAIRRVLASIEQHGNEGDQGFEEIVDRLKAALPLPGETPAVAAPPVPAPPPPVARVAEPLLAPKPVPPPPAAPAPAAEPETPVAKATDEAARPSSVADANIRVGVGLLDKLMDLVGELVLARNQILQYNAEREDAILNATSQRLNLITTELQGNVMKTRMQPIGTVWSNLPRVVRDMSVALGKQIRLDMDGTETELDRTIIEAIKDPLVHLVRNACDHGLEAPPIRVAAGKPAQGRLSLRAYHEGGQVNIEISDDGAGIDVNRVKQKAVEKGMLRPEQAAKLSDREALNLIFLAGFSTAQKVTNVSGRGVGMDVVKSHIEKIGGVIDITSRPGEGTTVKLKIPLTLAIIPGLLITSGGERFVIPQVSLLELIRLENDGSQRHIERVMGTPVYRRRGSLLPVAYLNDVLDLERPASDDVVNMVVLQAEDRQFGLVVDGISDTQEIVVKPLGKQLKGMAVYAGATIMGDGRVALILDVLGIGQASGVLTELHEQTRAAGSESSRTDVERQSLLLFRAGSFDRLAVPLSMVARLEEFPRESLEMAGGRQVVQYRGRILPLVSLSDLDGLGAAPDDTSAELAQVVVFNDGDHSVGLLVDQIIDIVDEAVSVRQRSRRKGLLGSAVVGDRVADFLDLSRVIQAASWTQGSESGAPGRCVLVAEASVFSRSLLRTGLDMAGYRVLEAATREEALRHLEQHPVDIVVTSLDLPAGGSVALVDALRSRSEWARIPVLALASSLDQARAGAAPLNRVQDCQLKFDHEAMIESVGRLASALASAEPVLAGAGK